MTTPTSGPRTGNRLRDGHRHRTALLVVALAALSTLLAGCGGDPAPAATGAQQAAYDKSLHDLLPEAVKQSGVLRVGTDASYAPMSMYAPDGRTILGVEPDLGAELGRVLGVEVRFVNADFTSILAKVADGRLDLGMSAITDTREREREVDFVNYFRAGTAIVVQRGNPAGVTDISDLCGRVVAVEQGTTQVDLLHRAQRNCDRPMRVRGYPTNSDALLQLRTGRAAAVLNDLPPAAFLATDKRTAGQYQLASTAQYEPGLYGVAVARDKQGLRDAVQGALEDLVAGDVYGDVLGRWGITEGAVDEVTVNSGT